MFTLEPTHEIVSFDQPRWVELPDGTSGCDLGPYTHSDGAAVYRTFADNGMCSGLLTGAPGSGKSVCLNNIAISQRASGKVVHVYLDGGSYHFSSSFLAEFAHIAAHGHDGAEQVLALVEGWLDCRARESNAQQLGGFVADEDRPGIQVIIEDAHRVFDDPDHADRWAEALTSLRKFGIGVLAATPGIELQYFGGNRALRKLLVAGNLICFQAGAVDLYSPRSIAGRRTPGYAVDGAQQPDDNHKVFRAAYTDDWGHIAAPLPMPTLDPLTEQVAERIQSSMRTTDSTQDDNTVIALPVARDTTDDDTTSSAATRPRGSWQDRVRARLAGWREDLRAIIADQTARTALMGRHADDIPIHPVGRTGRRSELRASLRRAVIRTRRPAATASWAAIVVFTLTAAAAAFSAATWRPETTLRHVVDQAGLGDGSLVTTMLDWMAAPPGGTQMVLWLAATGIWLSVTRNVAVVAAYGQYALGRRIVLAACSITGAWVAYQLAEHHVSTPVAFIAAGTVLGAWRAMATATVHQAARTRDLNRVHAISARVQEA